MKKSLSVPATGSEKEEQQSALVVELVFLQEVRIIQVDSNQGQADRGLVHSSCLSEDQQLPRNL